MSKYHNYLTSTCTFHVYSPKYFNVILFVCIVNFRNALNHRIIGCPVIIDNKKYKRNALMFNLCMVFDSHDNAEQFEEIVKKLAIYLKTLEVN